MRILKIVVIIMVIFFVVSCSMPTATAPPAPVTQLAVRVSSTPTHTITLHSAVSPTEISPLPAPAPDSLSSPEPMPEPMPDAELIMLAQTVYGEARGCSPAEQALVLWCIFNRVDDGRFGKDITAVVTARNQFQGYSAGFPVLPEILDLCEAERAKWLDGESPPTLAPYAAKTTYLYFSGDGLHNWFR